MKILLTVLAIALLASCYTERKASRQVVKAQADYPGLVGGLCSDFYPPIESIKEKIVHLPGEVQIIPGNTVTIDCDTVRGQSIVRVPCPPSTRQVDTLYRDREIQAVDRGRIQELESQVYRYQESYLKAQNGRDTWRTIGLIGIGLCLVWVVKKVVF